MVRMIVRPDKTSISIDIPEKYIGKEIEVIAFEKHEGAKKKAPKKKTVTFNAVSVDTRGYKFNRNEANE
jgi:hypothetical protein